MLIAALCALAAAATAGIFLASRHFLRKKLPASIALVHGLGGATGFLLVLLVVVQNPDFRLARQALTLFVVTILLGAVNLLFHLRKKRHRTSLILLHAAVAVSGVVTLIVAIVSGEPAATAATAPAGAVPTAAPSESPAKVAEPSGSAAAPAAAGVSAAPAASGAPAEPVAPASARELPLDASVRAALARSPVFDTKSAVIAPESLPAVEQIAKSLKEHPEVALVEVQGHADERGEDSANVALTLGRADAVVEALVARGVERKRLHSAGYGARCPADPACSGAAAPESCHAPERHAADRRVVFVPLRVATTSLRGEIVCARGAELVPPADREFHAP